MKTSPATIGLLTILLFATLGATAHATDRYKTNNTTALNLAGSWTNGLPTATDLAVFDSTLDATPKSYAIGGNLTFNGISFRDAQSAQTITATASSTLTLANGSPGIDITAASTSDFTIGCLLNLGSSGGQTFNVANSGRTLLISGAISGTGPLTKSGAGIFKSSNNGHTYTGGTIISDGTVQLGVHNSLAAGNVTVQNGATLDLNGFGLTNKANYVIHIAGTGVGNAGALVHNGGSQLNFALTNLVLDANASVGGIGRFDMRPVTASALPPSIDLAGHTLTKVGANQIWLQQASSITDGNIDVQVGVLGLNGMPLTGNGLVTVENGAELRIFRNAPANTVSTITRPITLAAGALVNYTGVATADAIDQSVGSSITLTGDATINGSVAGAVFELAGTISGGFGLTKTGPGTLLLSGGSTYSGPTLVSAGTLALGSAWNGSGAVTVNDNGGLEIRPAALNATLNVNSLTLGSSAGPTTTTFNLGGFANPSSSMVNVTNALTLIGTNTVNLAGTGLTAGTFKLIDFGSIAGTGGFAVGTVPGFTATLATNVNSIEITLEAAALAWRGNVNGTWQASNPAALDWFNVLSSAAAGFTEGAPVIFDETLTGTPSVSIVETVHPSSVTVSNTSTSYVFSGGGGKISGTTGLVKKGSGTLNVAVANDYTGQTTITDGTLQLGVAEAIPSATLNLAVNGTGTLDLNGFGQTVLGLDGNGTVDNTQATSAILSITGAGSFSGVIKNTGGAGSLSLKKTGSTTVQTLTGNNTYSGYTLIQGKLQVGSDRALGSGLIWMSFVGALSSDSTMAHTFTNALQFDSSTTPTLGDAVNNGVLTFTGPISMNGGSRTTIFNSDVVFGSGVENGVNFTKQGPGKLTMNGVNTYTGTTLINAGTLAGTGTFGALVNIAGGATLSPGTSIGTMTVNGANLFLNGTSTNHMELDAAANTNDRVQGMAQVTYGGTLEVVNLAGTPTIGQSFQLFSAATTAGSFAKINLPALPSDRAWSWNPASGTLSVVPPAATTPTNITFSVSGGNLELTWPGSHLGWIAQSNAVSVADTNFWYDIADSASATNLSISINPVLPQVFYRLRLP